MTISCHLVLGTTDQTDVFSCGCGMSFNTSEGACVGNENNNRTDINNNLRELLLELQSQKLKLTP